MIAICHVPCALAGVLRCFLSSAPCIHVGAACCRLLFASSCLTWCRNVVYHGMNRRLRRSTPTFQPTTAPGSSIDGAVALKLRVPSCVVVFGGVRSASGPLAHRVLHSIWRGRVPRGDAGSGGLQLPVGTVRQPPCLVAPAWSCCRGSLASARAWGGKEGLAATPWV